MTESSQHALDLRQQMEQIRCDLAEDVNDLTSDAKTLTDYRYYLRQFPWLSLAAAATVGYLLVPKRERQVVPDEAALRKLIEDNKIVVQKKSEVNKERGLIATGASLVAAAAMRAALSYAQRKASERLTNFVRHRDEAAADLTEYRPVQPR